MKKLFYSILIISTLLLFSVNCFAASKFGAINPKKEGSSSIGIEYFDFNNKWDPKDSGWDEFKSNQNQFSIVGEYSLSDKVQVNGNIGISDATIHDAFEGESSLGIDDEDFEDGPSPFVSFGIKGILSKKDNLSLGVFFQSSFYGKYNDDRSMNVSWSETYCHSTIDYNINVKEEVTIKNQLDLNLGLSFQAEYNKSILYFGPFIYMNKAKVKYDISGSYTEIEYGYTYRESFTESESCKYEEKSNIGVFVGADIELGKDFKVNGECQIRNKPSFGLSLSKTF